MSLAVSSISHCLNAVSFVAPRLAGKMAFTLFTNPSRRAEVRASERDVHEAATVEKFAVNGHDVVAYRWGSGQKPVLLVHGFEARGSRYTGFVPGLQALGCTPITFDVLGHGDSGGRGATILDYQAILGHLHDQYGPFYAIVAHSFGVTCVFHAIRTGVVTERLVAISGICDFSYTAEGFCRLLGLRSTIKQDLLRRSEMLFLPETEIWQRFSVSHQPETVTVPILVIHDEGDDYVLVKQAHKIVDAYQGTAKIITTHGLGHRRILSDQAVIGSVLDFIANTQVTDVD